MDWSASAIKLSAHKFDFDHYVLPAGGGSNSSLCTSISQFLSQKAASCSYLLTDLKGKEMFALAQSAGDLNSVSCSSDLLSRF